MNIGQIIGIIGLLGVALYGWFVLGSIYDKDGKLKKRLKIWTSFALMTILGAILHYFIDDKEYSENGKKEEIQTVFQETTKDKEVQEEAQSVNELKTLVFEDTSKKEELISSYRDFYKDSVLEIMGVLIDFESLDAEYNENINVFYDESWISDVNLTVVQLKAKVNPVLMYAGEIPAGYEEFDNQIELGLKNLQFVSENYLDAVKADMNGNSELLDTLYDIYEDGTVNFSRAGDIFNNQ